MTRTRRLLAQMFPRELSHSLPSRVPFCARLCSTSRGVTCTALRCAVVASEAPSLPGFRTHTLCTESARVIPRSTVKWRLSWLSLISVDIKWYRVAAKQLFSMRLCELKRYRVGSAKFGRLVWRGFDVRSGHFFGARVERDLGSSKHGAWCQPPGLRLVASPPIPPVQAPTSLSADAAPGRCFAPTTVWPR